MIKSVPLRAAVLGHPVAHSLSPEIFKFISGALRRPVRYTLMDTPPDKLPQAVALGKSGGWAGFNVTAPHKEKILAVLDSLSPEAEKIGAVNVVRFAGGAAAGHNTDADGFLDAFAERSIGLKGATAAVFGAGGAAKAVCYGLCRSDERRILLVNRTPSRAAEIKERFAPEFKRTEFRLHPDDFGPKIRVDFWINAAPAAQDRAFDPFPRKALKFHRQAWAYDLVYRPRLTPFLKNAQAVGMKTIPGLDMLIHQAVRTWEIWFGKISDAPGLKAGLQRHLARLLY